MTFKTILIDDERLARKELCYLLADYKDVCIVGEAKNLSEAISLINEKKPDLVFLDIQLRQENGFDLLEHVKHNFHLIFVTAFDEYAIRAFEINAMDYLLKPVNPKRLQASFDRLYSDIAVRAAQNSQLNIDDQLFLPLGEHSRFICITTISHICASGDYTELYTKSGVKILLEKSLKKWMERLPAQHFQRIHRSTIINLNEIASVKPLLNQTMEIELINVPRIFTVSRRYSKAFKLKFS